MPDLANLDSTTLKLLIALGVAAGVWLVLRLVQHVVIGRLAKWAEGTRTKWDDIAIHPLRRTSPLFLLAASLSVATAVTGLDGRIRKPLGEIFVVALVVQAGLWLNAAVSRWLTTYREDRLPTDASAVTTITAAVFLARLVLWSVILMLVLANLGVEIAPLIAGLGVGGIAVALALQNILGDLFASLSIVLDKPFVIGDFVIVDDKLGVVERIGLKTTRIRSLWGEQLIFANHDLLSSRLRNYGRMYERRVAFEIGVTYQTDRRQLEKIPVMIREIVKSLEKTRFDRSHLKAYGDFAIVYETVYYVLSPDYNTYMDIQQAINLAIHDGFSREGVDFAYPTQTLWLRRSDG